MAAVAAVLRGAPSRSANLLFIRRAEVGGDPWSGDMAFPGGRFEDGDADAMATAVRETREELGLDLEDLATPLVELDTVTTHFLPQHLAVHPFVFALRRDARLVPNAEVAAIHWFSVERLLSGEGRGEMTFALRNESYCMPCIRLDGTCIWGMTLRMVDDLLSRLRKAT
jgi:8-oxo-dGTP pyrophosphatase MutT (NUDIX family)